MRCRWTEGGLSPIRGADGTVDDYTVGSRNYNGSGGVSSGDPIPMGAGSSSSASRAWKPTRDVTILESRQGRGRFIFDHR